MATVTKSIGTSSRDYSTITSWEADLDDFMTYGMGDDAVGEVYNDSTFDERVVIDGGSSTMLNSVKLTVPSAQRHDGKAGTGAKIQYSGSVSAPSFILKRSDLTVEWLELDMSSAGSGVLSAVNLGANAHTNVFFRNNIIHNLHQQSGDVNGIYVYNSGSSSNTRYIMNNIIYEIKDTNDNAYGIRVIGSNYPVEIYNNTVYYTQTASDVSSCYEINDSDATLKNNIGARPTGSPNRCFGGTGFSSSTHDYNLSTDSTATGTNSVTGEAYTDLFVSTSTGTEDLHLKEGADAIDAGTDLGTSPTNVNIDIDGRDRDAQGDTWDIGADERVAAGNAMPAAYNLYKQLMVN